MIYNDDSLEELRRTVKEHLSEHRFQHTLGVERAAMKLARIFLPDRIFEIRACALLHDITKELPFEEQRELINESGICLSDEDLETLNAWHSFSAVGYIKKYLPDYATPEILDGVFCHTLGCERMSLFSTIIFISDFIEDGRKYKACKLVADYLWSSLAECKEYSEKLKALYRACIMSIEYTVASVEERGLRVNSRTLLTKNSFQALI